MCFVGIAWDDVIREARLVVRYVFTGQCTRMQQIVTRDVTKDYSYLQGMSALKVLLHLKIPHVMLFDVVKGIK